MDKKAIVYLVCSAVTALLSAAVAFTILADNLYIILNINYSAMGMISGIAAVVLAINAIKENAPKWACIVIMVVSILSAGVCMLNFIACVMCISMWFI